MTQQPALSPQKTLSQRRAHQAWAYINEANGQNFQDKYATLTQKLAAMIQVNGLGATVAFLRAKAKNKPSTESHHQLLYQQVSAWICERVYDDGNAQADLLEKIMNQSSDLLRRATTETIEFAIWLRRFSESVFGEKLSEGDDE